MKGIAVSLILTALLTGAPLARASSITTETQSYAASNGQKASVQNLYCQASSNQYYQSKLVLIQTRSSDYDFALTTAHGIQRGEFSEFESCFIRDGQGQRRKVLDAYIPKDYQPGVETDWAVIKLAKVNSSDISRFALSAIEGNGPSGTESMQVTFPRARGLNFNTQHCRAYASEMLAFENIQILAHNCRVLKGQSGSPITIKHENQTRLIGLHLGKAFVFRSPISKKPEHMGYFRVIDQDMIDEINMAIRSFTQ